MRSKFLKILILIVQIIMMGVCGAIAARGFFLAQDIWQELPFIQSVARIGMLLVFTISYYRSCLSGGSPENIFMVCFLFSASLAEIRVFNDFANLTGISLMSLMVLSRISIFAVMAMLLSLIGSGLYFQNNEYGAVSLYSWIGLAGALFMGLLLPAPLSFENLWRMNPSFWIFAILSAVAAVVNILLLFTEAPGAGTVRLLASVILDASIFATYFFNISYSNLIGTSLFVAGCLINTIVLTRNTIRL